MDAIARTATGPCFRRKYWPRRSARAGGLGIATVYRNIKSLVEDGWLVPVELPGRPARYELAGKEHHHHFYCNGCGLVFELKGCIASFRDMIPRGFRVTAHEVLLYGMCQGCRSSAAVSG